MSRYREGGRPSGKGRGGEGEGEGEGRGGEERDKTCGRLVKWSCR